MVEVAILVGNPFKSRRDILQPAAGAMLRNMTRTIVHICMSFLLWERLVHSLCHHFVITINIKWT